MRRGIHRTSSSTAPRHRLTCRRLTTALMAASLITGLALAGTVEPIAQASASSTALRHAPGHTPTNPTVPRSLKSATRLTKGHSGFVVTPAPAKKPTLNKGASTSASPNPPKTMPKITGGGPVRPKVGHDPTLTFSEHSGTITKSVRIRRNSLRR